MMRYLSYALLGLGLYCLTASAIWAQVQFSTVNTPSSPVKRACGTSGYSQLQEELHPGLAEQRQQLEKEVQRILNNTSSLNSKTQLANTIPVVVHVVYYNAQDSLSFSRIQSNITQLNVDYNRLNFDTVLTPNPFRPIAGRMGIQFVLANRDPNQQQTNGVTYTKTNINGFGLDDKMKFTAQGGKDIWDRTQYLNIWVCKLNNSLLGYATQPDPSPSSDSIDGIVIDYQYFGGPGTGASAPYNSGRTLTHEVGHFLGLYHIWGDTNCGDDFVNDTPTSTAEHYGCPSYPQPDCSSSSAGAMYMNYMDYTDDQCMNIFTNGQVARMNSFMATAPRAALYNSPGITNIGTSIIKEEGIRVYPNPSQDGIFYVDTEDADLLESCQMYCAPMHNPKELSTAKGVIDLSAYPAGVYFLQFRKDDQLKVVRLIKY